MSASMMVSLADAVLRSAWNPAKEIHHAELGHLAPGVGADVAVWSIANGNFGFGDSAGGRISGKQRLTCELTQGIDHIVPPK